MKRPFGLILSAILLCLAALFLLFMTAIMVFAVFFSTKVNPSAPQMPHFLIYIELFVCIFYLGIAVWDALTAIGILRLRSWARYSIIAIGACTAFFNLMAIFGIAVSRSAVPPQPGADPRILQFVLLVLMAIETLIAAIGVWLVVYFTRPRISDLFRAMPPPPAAYDPATYPNLPPPPYPTLPQKTYTGFFSSPAHAPAAIKIIGWVLLICSIFTVPGIFLPLPAFMLGFILPLPASHLLFAGLAVINLFVGYGLLKLRNSARLVAIAFMLLGICNAALSLLPWYQEQFRTYIVQYLTRFTAMMPTVPGQPAPDIAYAYSRSMIVFNSCIGGAVALFVVWLLCHYRSSFSTQPQTETV